MSSKPKWGASYPWGAKSPQARIDDLRRAEARALEERRRFEEVFRERMIDFERRLEAITQNIAIAEKCEQDRLRRAVAELGARARRRGIEVEAVIAGRRPSEALLAELEAAIARQPEPVAGNDIGLEEGSPEPFPMIDMEDDELVTIEDIRRVGTA